MRAVALTDPLSRVISDRSPSNRLRHAAAAALTGLGLLVASCGGGDTQATAEETLCADLATFSTAVTGLHGLDPETEQADWEAQTQAVRNSWQSVEFAADGVAQADIAELESSVSDLESAVAQLGEDVTFQQALTQLQPQLTQLSQAWNAVWTSLDCASSTSTNDS